MNIVTRASGLFVLACLATLVIGCGGFDQGPLTVVWLGSIDKVAGKWDGRAQQVLPDMREAGQVMLMIQDNGAYEFITGKPGDLSLGAGMLTLRNGRLISETDERRAMVTLYEREKQQVLGADVTLKNEERYYVEMSRAK